MTDEQLTELFGPLYPYADHKRGQRIKFSDEGVMKEGIITWVRWPGPASEGGKSLPAVYIVDAGEGWPHMVYPADIVEG